MGQELAHKRRGEAEPDHSEYEGTTRYSACLHGRDELSQLSLNHAKLRGSRFEQSPPPFHLGASADRQYDEERHRLSMHINCAAIGSITLGCYS